MDAAFFMVPVDAIPDAVADAVAAGVKGGVVLTSGYSEIGGEGSRLEAELVERARAGGLHLLGPNSMGFVDVGRRSAMTTLPPIDPVLKGGVAIVSQSGFTASELMRTAHRFNIGLSFVAATGNEAMIGADDIIDYLVAESNTKVIAIYAESIRHPERFARAARAAYSAGKPIVMLKVGRSELTAQVAAAHTGALVGDDNVFDAVCRELGVIRVRTLEDLVITAGLFGLTGRIDNPGIAFLSSSGGCCTVAADAAHDAGISMPPLAEATKTELREILPSYAGTLNPLDLTGGWVNDPEQLGRAIGAVSRDPAIGRVLVGFEVPDTVERKRVYEPMYASLGAGLAACHPPGIIVSMSMAPATDATRAALADAGIPGYSAGIDPTFRALSGIIAWSKPRPATLAAMPAPAPATPLPRARHERDLLDALAAFGVPVVPGKVTLSAQEAVMAAATMDQGAGVVLKVLSADIAHKTEVGGVRLNLIGPDAIAKAWREIDDGVRLRAPQARLEGIIVSPMRRGGIELIVGITRDPQWGSILAVGLGGVLVEVLRDAALARLPVAAPQVEDMLRSLQGARLLEGYRGAPAADIPALAEIIVRIARAALAYGDDLVALEVNPLSVNGAAVEALDALAIWSDAAAR